jgi:hypothetical protein
MITKSLAEVPNSAIPAEAASVIVQPAGTVQSLLRAPDPVPVPSTM